MSSFCNKKIRSILLLNIILYFPTYGQVTKLADTYLFEKKYINAITEYNKIILSYPNNINVLDLGNSYLRKGVCYFNLNLIDSALYNYFQSLPHFVENEERKASTYKNISNAYLKKSNFTLSDKYNQLSNTFFEKLNDTSVIVDLKIDAINIKIMQQDFITALALQKSMLSKYYDNLSDQILAKSLFNLGICYNEISNDSAIYYLLEANRKTEEINDSSLLLIVSNNVGKYYLDRNETRKALPYFLKSYEIINLIKADSSFLATVNKNLADTYIGLGQYQKAYNHRNNELEIKEILLDSEKTKIAAELSEKYESDKKDTQIKSQTIENNLKSRNITFAIIGLIITGILASLAYYNFRKKKNLSIALEKQKNEVQLLNKELDDSNQVKTKLFSIISHDLRAPVSNLYTYLQLQQLQEQKEGMQEVSQQTEQLLETLEDMLLWSKSQLHQFTPTIERINILNVTDQILQLVQTQITNKRYIIQNDIAEYVFVHSDLNMLSIVLRNVIFNAIKYAAPNTTIIIAAKIIDNTLDYAISNVTTVNVEKIIPQLMDNEINSAKGGLGTTLVNDFLQKLKGNIAYKGQDFNLTSTIQLPIKN